MVKRTRNRILFLTEGGDKIGLGHLSRCAALGQAIRSLNPAVEVRYFIKGDRKALEFVMDQGIEPVLSDWVRDRIDRSLLSKCRAVIIDSYLAPAPVYDYVFGTRPKLTVIAIDDYNRIRYAADAVVSPSIYGDRISYIPRRNIKTRYLVGRKYVILRKEFGDVRPRKPRKEIRDVLIVFGGITKRTFLRRFLKYLSCNAPTLNFHVVAGYLEVGSSHRRVKVYRGLSAAGMCKLMLGCDVCFSAGGQTLYELARTGTPTIGICFSDNQKLNLKTLSKRGVIKYIGRFDGPRIHKKAVDTLRRLESREIRMRMSRKGRSFIDGKGAERIAKWILRA